ncbi:TPA: hypothetical protein I8Y16_004033 [Raoultella ornithinolytica]|nr:hypothetical protein [Raoultella ornithinolytica]HAT1670178.1 hypothetical protein [Raoultella ornithinolytica]
MITNKIITKNIYGQDIFAEYKTEVFSDGSDMAYLFTRNSEQLSWKLAFILLNEKQAAAVGEVIIENYCIQ